jgi:dihydroorotase
VHTLLRGRFVMRDGQLVTEAKGWGRNVKSIQCMPAPRPRNTELYSSAITATPPGVRPNALPSEEPR